MRNERFTAYIGGKVDDYLANEGASKAEQIDALEDLAAELQERAEALRTEMRGAGEASAEAGEEDE